MTTDFTRIYTDISLPCYLYVYEQHEGLPSLLLVGVAQSPLVSSGQHTWEGQKNGDQNAEKCLGILSTKD